MSGIAAVFLRNQAPVDESTLQPLVARLTERGPDAQHLWYRGPFGLIHALFQTTDDNRVAAQPLSLDGQIWLTADARIDARRELIGQLNERGCGVSPHNTDAELIWHAYATWGHECAKHLLGDFAFVVADVREQLLYAARDQLGVKPLYYAAGEGWLVVSNMLDCVRQWQHVSNQLNETYIADFLMFGWNTDVRATAFAEIQRLAPAHCLEGTATTIQSRPYWTLTVPAEDRRYRLDEHVERFREVFDAAVADRLRTDKAAILFSGGKDSTSVAAAALPLLRQRSAVAELYALCAVYDRIIPDQERYFAALAAGQLGVPLEFLVCDDLPMFDEDWDTKESQLAEPADRTFWVQRRLTQTAAQRSRVVLGGEGGDEAIRPAKQYYQKLFQEYRLGRWAADCLRHVWTQRSLPPVGLRTLLYKGAWRRLRGQPEPEPHFPVWLGPELAHQYSLHDRWHDHWHGRKVPKSFMPLGITALSTHLMPDALDRYDTASMAGPVEFRFPYLDLRVIECCWSIPPIPLRFEKYLLRRVFAGRLPEEVLRRRKQGLADTVTARQVNLPVTWRECLRRTPELLRFVAIDPTSASDLGTLNTYDLPTVLRAFELASWMHYRWRQS